MIDGLPDKLTTRIFAGCDLNSEIRMHLNQSVAWKHATILTALTCNRLQEISYRGKNYLGFYLDHKITIKELIKVQQTIKQQLKSYCSGLEVENRAIYIFPQVFIA